MLQIQVNKPNVGFKSRENKLDQAKNRPSTQATTIGILAGMTVSGLTARGIRIVIGKSFGDIFKKLKPFSVQEAFNLSKQMMLENGLDKKGVEIGFLKPLSQKRCAVKFKRDFIDKNKFQNTPRFYKNRIVGAYAKYISLISSISRTHQGKNAVYLVDKKLAYAPISKPLLILHELGHAINYKNVVAKNLLKAGRSLPRKAVPLILFTALIHKKQENSENKNPITKTLDFVKDHAAGLTFLTFVPMLFDEAFASGLALKFAKGKLDKPVFNNLTKTYAAAFSKYFGFAAAAALGVKVACIVKNKVENSKILNENKKEDENVFKETMHAGAKFAATSIALTAGINVLKMRKIKNPVSKDLALKLTLPVIALSQAIIYLIKSTTLGLVLQHQGEHEQIKKEY